MWLLIALTTLLIGILHWLITRPYGYWKEKGIPYPKPTVFVGNIGSNVIMKKTMGMITEEFYKAYNDCRYIGMYMASTPAVLLRDPELIKDVIVKSFSSFHDNDAAVDENIDPIVGRNPFFLKGQKWKAVRTQVTSSITTGKIKNMFKLMTNVSKNLAEYLKHRPESKNGTGIETKELAAKFTTDVVAICAFGLDGRNLIEEDTEFRKMGRKLLSPSTWSAIKFQMLFFFPVLNKILRIKIMSTEVENWFRGILTETIKFRKENNIVRNDYLDMMIALKDKPGEYEFTDMDVMAQAMTFYIDGFETSSIALSFVLFELARHPEIQAKLRNEMDTIIKKYNDEITYDAIQEMNYLDMVISEGLRLYPPGDVLRKLCTVPYKFPPYKIDGSGTSFDCPEGTSICIPVKALHYDPEYFPEPEKFDPERFTGENKQTRPKHSYLPFGDGPRQCLGFRFALSQIKAAMVSVISNFEIKVNSKTQLPIKLDPRYIMPAAIGGLWLDYIERKK